MVKTTRYCDHCGKEIDTMKDYLDTEIIVCYSWCDVDLCGDCYDKLKHIVKQFCNKEQ